jgi:hypothetical protein
MPTKRPHPYASNALTLRITAATPKTATSTIARAALPSALSGMIRARRDAGGPLASAAGRRGGTRLRSRKKARFRTGAKNRSTRPAGSPASRSRPSVSTTPTAMKGSEMATSVP